jgi:putative transposase
MEKRSGSLWEGRYKSSPINANEYLLACCRYIELNPVRAAIAEDHTLYRWSSCPAKTGMVESSWLDLDPFYQSVGTTPNKRAKKYKEWLYQTVPEDEWKLIREAAQRGQLTANRKFEKEISKKLGRRIELRGPGRPKKIKK